MSKIQLICYGWVEAQPAKNVKPGDTLVWNYKSDNHENKDRNQINIR